MSNPAAGLIKEDPGIIAAKNARNKEIVRWYLMIYPYGRKGLIQGLDREIERRMREGEPPIEYFAPVYVEAREIDNRIVRTEKQLFFNYVFVHASENELFRMKKFEEQYNFPRREHANDGTYHYPYVSDEMIMNLKWISRSYSGVIPVYMGDTSWLIKGDRIRITAGPLKGIEATLFDNRQNSRREIMVMVDSWLSVPLLQVREGQYKVISLSGESSDSLVISDDIMPTLHEILCRQYKREITDGDYSYVRNIVARFAGKEPGSKVMRCKLYSILLTAYTILCDEDRFANLHGITGILIPTLTAEQSKALLLTALYGCTDNSIYYHQAHQIIDPWARETNPKKLKKQLLRMLADYDRILGH